MTCLHPENRFGFLLVVSHKFIGKTVLFSGFLRLPWASDINLGSAWFVSFLRDYPDDLILSSPNLSDQMRVMEEHPLLP